MGSGNPHSMEQRVAFVAMELAGKKPQTVADELGLKRGTTDRWRREAKHNLGQFLGIREPIETKTEVLLDRIAKQQADLARAEDVERILREAVEAAVAPIPRDRSGRKPYSAPKSKTEPELVMLELSDLQIGQVVRPDEVAGLNTYDTGVFCERLDLLVRKVLALTEIERNGRPIHHLVVNILGDIVEGEAVFPGQAFEIDVDGLQQVLLAVDRLAGAIATFAQHFERVSCYCVAGNHGRVGRKGQHSQRLNLDRLAYVMLQRALAEHDNVWFAISDGALLAYECPTGTTHVLMHGDQVRSWNGVPYYAMDRAASRVSDLLLRRVRYLHLGHHHAAAQVPGVACERILNGSFVGTSNFSANRLLVGDVPRQWFYGIDSAGERTWTYDIRLADRPSLVAGDGGVLSGEVA